MTSSITPPFSLQSALYCAWPSVHFERSFVTSFCAVSRARGPSRVISPMCETSNISAFSHMGRSDEHTSELQSLRQLVCRRPLEKQTYSTWEGRMSTPPSSRDI